MILLFCFRFFCVRTGEAKRKKAEFPHTGVTLSKSVPSLGCTSSAVSYLDWSSLPQVCLTRTTCRLKCRSSGTFPGASIQKVWGGAQESVFFFKQACPGDFYNQRCLKGPLSGEEALDPLAGNMPVCLWGESSPASIFLYKAKM